MFFKCLDTGVVLTDQMVRTTRAYMTNGEGRRTAIYYPKDPATWDKRLMEWAHVERVPSVHDKKPAPIKVGFGAPVKTKAKAKKKAKGKKRGAAT